LVLDHQIIIFRKSSVGVSKIDDFCHLGVEGETEGMFPDDYALTTTWPALEISLLRTCDPIDVNDVL